jgi:hypothetical protein
VRVPVRPRPVCVVAPDGSEWVVQTRYFKLPLPDERDPDWADFERTISRVPVVGLIAAGALRGVELFVVPVVAATVGGRPWITAVRNHPPARMMWRVVQGASAQAAASQIARRLREGVERPLIPDAEWVGPDGRESGPW